MDDLGGSHILDEALDHGFAGQAEFVDAALDGRHSQFEVEPVAQKFLDLAPRKTAAQRQRGDESGEHGAHQATLAHPQVSFAPLDQRTQSDARAFDVVVTAGAAHGKVAVSGRGDLKSHVASDEFEAVVGADAAALQVGAEGGAASRAHHRRVRDFSAHHNRLTAPMPFRAGLFAGALGGLVLVRLAGFLGRSVGRIGGGAVRVGGNRFASLFTPIGVVARRRTRTGRRILARAVGQQTRQLMQPPSQFLELLARHPREVGALDIVQLGGELARHIERRIPFAPKRKPPHDDQTATVSASSDRSKGGCERLPGQMRKEREGGKFPM